MATHVPRSHRRKPAVFRRAAARKWLGSPPSGWGRAGALGLGLTFGAFALGCSDDTSCLEDQKGCIVEPPCESLRFECSGGAAIVRVLREGDPIAGGIDALASVGDIVLENDRAIAVIDALDHPHYVAPTGGTLLDLGTRGEEDDSLNQVLQAVGLLPGDAARYDAIELVRTEGTAAIQVRGTLDGDRNVRIATRYEMRPCDPGVRVRTEIVNLGRDPEVIALADGFYWGARSSFAFAPYEDGGFLHPEIELDDATAAYRSFPYLATLPSTDPPAAYACVPCSMRMLEGFQSEQVSAAGIGPRVVRPNDYLVFERFIGVAHDASVRGASDLALDVRRRLFGERYVELRGVLTRRANHASEATGTLLIERGHVADAHHTPVTQVTPDEDGVFVVRVPANASLVLRAYAFGREAATREIETERIAIDVGEIELDRPASLDVAVTVDGAPDHALLFVHPADDATAEATRGTRFGLGFPCTPYLGSPYGGAPSCNRTLIDGETSFDLPPGRYDVYATAGPFASLARETVELEGGERTSLAMALTRLPVAPAGSLEADLHVHGAASFDSSFPDFDRVRAFLASGIEVLAATDHDVVHSYGDAIAALDADDRLVLISGVETTGHALFDLVPGAEFPQVIGHWNFWPLEERPDAPYRGAPYDEIAEPGLLFTRMADIGFDADTGVIQLNHPFGPADFGRDLGFPRAIGLDARKPLPREYDGSGGSLLLRTPAGARFGNGDYHTQEVMNTTANDEYLSYRALWFYYLNEGLVRAGTANSDSHTLADSILGTPRNVVFTSAEHDDFDVAAFDADLRHGHVVGTNGPMIEATLIDDSGQYPPSVDTISLGANAHLSIRVTAAPWVPVEQVRIIVNGNVAQTLTDLDIPGNPFGDEVTVRLERTIDLGPLLASISSDAWIVVEAGAPLMAAADLDCDGIPDTGDNDNNGTIDARDVDVSPSSDPPIDDVVIDTSHCEDDVGFLRNPPIPSDRDDLRHIFGRASSGASPAAFTNPFVLDLDGGGFSGVRR